MFSPMFCMMQIAFFIVFTMLVPVDARAQNFTVPEQVLNLQKHYQKAHSITFDFAQQTVSAGRTRDGAGKAVFLRMDQQGKDSRIMRWDYLTPFEQVIVNTDDQVQMYTKNDQQLIITSAETLGNDITLSLFSQGDPVDQIFEILPDEKNTIEDQLITAILVPKTPHQQLQSVQIWFTTQYQLVKIAMQDHFDTRTVLSLSHFATDTIQPDDRETIEAITTIHYPPDTEIIRQ